jgi:hypothetical protein
MNCDTATTRYPLRVPASEDLQFGWLQGTRNSLTGKKIVVAGARYVPNLQLLSIRFRSELIHSAA